MLLATRDEDGHGLSDAELEDQLLTLLLAGHETTAGTLAFCFERLSRHPDALERLTAAIREGLDDPYLGAVIDETQRVRSIRGLHGSDVFKDASEFRPERFLEARPDPYSFIPFGGGSRRCLGAAFARLEMKTVLSTVLESYDLQPTTRPGEARDRMSRFSTIPSKGGRVTFWRPGVATPATE